MSQLPSISAVVPNYNYARYLEQAVRSLLEQTVPFRSVIVVDDGSTDGSMAILEKLPPSVVVVRKQNGGQLSACRHGIQLTDADYVYCLDADDRARPDLVEEVLAVSGRWPAKIQFQLQPIDEAGNPSGTVFPNFPEGYSNADMLRDNQEKAFYVCPPTSGNVFRRTALLEAGLATMNGRSVIDGTPALIAPYVGEVVTLPKVLGEYRVHDNSMSRWGRPTIESLGKEIEANRLVWQEVAQRFPDVAAPSSESAFIAERRMLIRGLSGWEPPVPEVKNYVAAVSAGSGSVAGRALLAVWSFLLLVPSLALRRRLIEWRRTSHGRPRWMSYLVRPLLRKR